MWTRLGQLWATCGRANGKIPAAKTHRQKINHFVRDGCVGRGAAARREAREASRRAVAQFIGGCNDGGLGGTVPLLKSGKPQEMLK